jgi:hypothetical protein
MPEKRANKWLTDARTESLYRIICDGAEFLDYIQFVREQQIVGGSPWFVGEGQKPLSASQLYRYINKAEALVKSRCQLNGDQEIGRLLIQRRKIHAMAVAQGDVRAANSVLDSLERLLTKLGVIPAEPKPNGSNAHGPYPTLEAMVLAVIRVGQRNGEALPQIGGPIDDTGNPTRDGTPVARSDTMPSQPRALLQPLQNSGE